ncbi:OHCU decarboxylase, partial [Pseudomonas syringae]|uniref:2-oxo-4-hydroxy-4-carboxy-5-ureidoimidazoline decarboxylase n=1 Tax=Pseudomonas syringae TaxID=317 RepID=UPI001F92A954
MSELQNLKPSTLSRDAFTATFADVYEHSPWIAQQAFDQGADPELDQLATLHARMSEILLNATYEQQWA